MKVLPGFLSFFLSFWALLVPFITHNRMAESSAKLYPYHLHNIAHGLETYVKAHNGQLPPSASWCAALAESDSSLTPGVFTIDPKNAEQLSDFGMNANVSGLTLSDLPKDTVLVFETPLTKNPAGGPELMSMNSHPIKGCFILFADMHVEFVRAEDFNNLRWKP